MTDDEHEGAVLEWQVLSLYTQVSISCALNFMTKLIKPINQMSMQLSQLPNLQLQNNEK